jgi:hypothetical protein
LYSVILQLLKSSDEDLVVGGGTVDSPFIAGTQHQPFRRETRSGVAVDYLGGICSSADIMTTLWKKEDRVLYEESNSNAENENSLATFSHYGKNSPTKRVVLDLLWILNGQGTFI